jgi:hypothetical protein
VHGFAFSGEKAMMAVPFQTVDSVSWKMPEMWNRWLLFKGKFLGGVPQATKEKTLGLEAEEYLKREERARVRWEKIWKGKWPAIRLVVGKDADYLKFALTE